MTNKEAMDHTDDPRGALAAGEREEIFRINDNLLEHGLEENEELEDDARGVRVLDKAGRVVSQRMLTADQVRERLAASAVEV